MGKDKHHKVAGVDAIAEIVKIADEVFFTEDPDYEEQIKLYTELEAKIEAKKTLRNQARTAIKNLFTSTVDTTKPADDDPWSSIIYDSFDFNKKLTIIKTKKGELYFVGNQGPYITSQTLSVTEEGNDAK